MIHVMNPFKMSLAMFRLTSLGLEYQAQMMKTLTRMAMVPLASAAEEEEAAKPAKKTVTASKPAARRSHGPKTPGKPAARRPRKPSNPPAMPEPVSKLGKAEDDAAENVPV